MPLLHFQVLGWDALIGDSGRRINLVKQNVPEKSSVSLSGQHETPYSPTTVDGYREANAHKYVQGVREWKR